MSEQRLIGPTALTLGTFLRAQGIDARFAGDTVRPGENLDEHLARAGVPWVRELRLSRKVRVADVLHDAQSLRAWVRSGNPDLLHASFPHDHFLALWAARGVPSVRVFRTAHRRRDVEPGFRIRALKRTDGVIVHARSYRDALIARGLAPERVAAIPGGVDSARFSPGRAPELRDLWGVPRDAPLLGMVARMKPERGHGRCCTPSPARRRPGRGLCWWGAARRKPSCGSSRASSRRASSLAVMRAGMI